MAVGLGAAGCNGVGVALGVEGAWIDRAAFGQRAELAVPALAVANICAHSQVLELDEQMVVAHIREAGVEAQRHTAVFERGVADIDRHEASGFEGISSK